MVRRMPKLPRAMLIDLDDTILSAFGQGPNQWQRVIAEHADRLTPHQADDIIEAILEYSRWLWADEARHKDWRHRIGDARRHIVESAFAQLLTQKGHKPPPAEVLHWSYWRRRHQARARRCHWRQRLSTHLQRLD